MGELNNVALIFFYKKATSNATERALDADNLLSISPYSTSANQF